METSSYTGKEVSGRQPRPQKYSAEMYYHQYKQAVHPARLTRRGATEATAVWPKTTQTPRTTPTVYPRTGHAYSATQPGTMLAPDGRPFAQAPVQPLSQPEPGLGAAEPEAPAMDAAELCTYNWLAARAHLTPHMVEFARQQRVQGTAHPFRVEYAQIGRILARCDAAHMDAAWHVYVRECVGEDEVAGSAETRDSLRARRRAGLRDDARDYRHYFTCRGYEGGQWYSVSVVSASDETGRRDYPLRGQEVSFQSAFSRYPDFGVLSPAYRVLTERMFDDCYPKIGEFQDLGNGERAVQAEVVEKKKKKKLFK